MELRIDEVRTVTNELWGCINTLLRQLSSSADPMSREDLEALVSTGVSTLLVAYADRAPVGMLTLVLLTIPSGRRAMIEDVVVDEKWRGFGIGRALTMEALNRARIAKVRTIDLTSSPKRVAANAMYQQLGFRRRHTNVYRLLP